jgi:transcriptional regulator with XRE-family HTH domain
MPSTRVKPPSEKDLRRAFAEVIGERRNEQALSQEKLAETSDLSMSYVSLLERGQRNLTVYTAARIAAALGLQTSELVLQAEAKLKR